MLTSSALVALGGALGSLGRFWLGELFAAMGLVAFPWATLAANISGSFAIGLIASLAGPDGRPLAGPGPRLFWMVGICGGYTTFSAFSLQTLALAQGGELGRAALNIVLSLALCLTAVWLGCLAGSLLSRLMAS